MDSLESRFWSKVDKRGPDDCWPWAAARLPRGYGHFSLNGRAVGAHRVAYELSTGSIPSGLFVLHSCDNPPCCNPAHLRVGTPADNMRDKVDRGRARTIPRRLTDEQAREIRARAKTESQSALSREFGLGKASIRKIIRGRTYREGVGAREGSAQAEPNQPAGREQAV